MTTLVTHAGSFHADDLFATALLLALHPGAEVVRTRDADRIDALNAAGAIVYDVGGIHDPARRRYDHHQPGRPTRPEPAGDVIVPYSALGLLWQDMGRAYLQTVLGPMDDEALDSLVRRVDQRFVLRVDMADNGTIPSTEAGLLHPFAATRILEDFVPDFDAPPEACDAAFLDAVEVAGRLMAARVRTIAADARALRLVRAALRERPEPRWCELPRSMPYLGGITAEKADDVLYVVMPDREGSTWQISAVRASGESLGCRKPFPEAWAGLRGGELAAVTGVEDAVFCHLGRFLAIAQTRAGALRLLHQALDAP